jgi:hypothetical protein
VCLVVLPRLDGINTSSASERDSTAKVYMKKPWNHGSYLVCLRKPRWQLPGSRIGFELLVTQALERLTKRGALNVDRLTRTPFRPIWKLLRGANVASESLLRDD